MRFAHLGDCHLGGWRFPELQELNMQSFSMAIDISIKEKVDMLLITGDLFDSAYPAIEILKKAFAEFKKLKDAKIPCYIIAGSHDYSVAGKTFLEVLEHAGFCENVFKFEERDEKIILQPTIIKNFALYGYPGKKSGLEVPDLRRVTLQDAPGFFKIFLLHTTITEAIGTLPIESISIKELPKADYYALGHLHIDFCRNNVVYAGPIFPNNFEELEELKNGQFYIIESNGSLTCTKIPLVLKQVLSINLSIDNTLSATEKIISELNKHNLNDKIIMLKLSGKMSQGKVSDIKFDEIEKFTKENNAYIFIKNISKITFEESEIQVEAKDMHEVEETMIKNYFDKSPTKFNDKIPQMLKSLSIEKQEDEKNITFNDRLLGELQKILNY
ncbi:MAG: exonuclease SbcCD subunit D [Candidatus Pacearchaeota archaeon]|jgi:hypothetical protein